MRTSTDTSVRLRLQDEVEPVDPEAAEDELAADGCITFTSYTCASLCNCNLEINYFLSIRVFAFLGLEWCSVQFSFTQYIMKNFIENILF